MNTIPDFCMSPADSIVDLRVRMILDQSDLPLNTFEDSALNLQIRTVVALAYRAGLRDGLVRLGELIQ